MHGSAPLPYILSHLDSFSISSSVRAVILDVVEEGKVGCGAVAGLNWLLMYSDSDCHLSLDFLLRPLLLLPIPKVGFFLVFYPSIEATRTWNWQKTIHTFVQ